MTQTTFKPVEEQLAYLKKGTAEIIPADQLKADLEKSRASGKPLTEGIPGFYTVKGFQLVLLPDPDDLLSPAALEPLERVLGEVRVLGGEPTAEIHLVGGDDVDAERSRGLDARPTRGGAIREEGDQRRIQ